MHLVNTKYQIKCISTSLRSNLSEKKIVPFGRLFFFGLRLETLCTNLYILAAGFLGLKIDGHGSFGGDVGVRAALGGFGSAAADLAESTHIFQCSVNSEQQPAKNNLLITDH